MFVCIGTVSVREVRLAYVHAWMDAQTCGHVYKCTLDCVQMDWSRETGVQPRLLFFLVLQSMESAVGFLTKNDMP